LTGETTIQISPFLFPLLLVNIKLSGICVVLNVALLPLNGVCKLPNPQTTLG
jgi:hypothetical protein